MKRAVSIALFSLSLLGAGAATAQGSVEQAKVFFDAGATAYAKGDFRAAIQAFEEAYRLSQRPAILFSMAQAHRRQYFVDRRPDDVRRAVDLYKQYIGKVPQGGRKADAVQALSELDVTLQRLGGDAGDKGAPAQAVKAQTRLMVTSPVKDSKVSLDGAAPVELPLIAEVKPGKHVIKVMAEGYFEEQREVLAVEGNLIPNDVPLRERPAKLTVKARDGAEIAVDGRPMGVTPLVAPIEVPSGRHLIAVTKNGSRAFTLEVDLSHGEEKTVVASLPVTGQRVTAFGFIGLGVAGVGVGAAAAVMTLREQALANDVLAKKKKSNITGDELASYNASLKARDDWRRVAIAGLAAGGAVAATGLLLYAFDQPVITLSPPKLEDRPKKPVQKDEAPVEISAVPSLAPGFLGGSFVGRF